MVSDGANGRGTVRAQPGKRTGAPVAASTAVNRSPDVEAPIGVPASKRVLRSQGRQTMQRLLDAAMVAFDRRGYHATRVSDVVDIAQMSHGTFYLYFANMTDLARALTIEAAADASMLYEAMAEVGTAIDGESRERLRVWIGDYSKLWLRYAPLFRSWTDLAAADESMGERIRHTFTTLTDGIATRISAVGRPGDLSPEVAATAVVAMLDRFHYLRDFIGRPVDDEALETLTTMIHRAVFAPVD